MLDIKNQKYLLDLAKQSILYYLENNKTIKIDETLDKKLLKKKATFVTLRQANNLKGCIGTIEPIYPLYKSVIENSISAAFHDFRFYPIQSQEEVNTLEIEISLSSEIEQTNYEDINPHQDGLIIKKGNKSATFLPQVWQELSTKEDFFKALCDKADIIIDIKNIKSEKNLLIYKYSVFSFKNK